MKFYNKGVIHPYEDVSLSHDVVFLFPFLDIFLL